VLRFVLAIAFGIAALTSEAAAGYCPGDLGVATRLVLVVVPTMDTTKAVMQTFERDTPASAWTRSSAPEPTVVGARGIAWGDSFRSFARGDEPIKHEGDQRTPAGIYRFGASFGFAKTNRPGYLHLTPGANFCVDDPSSPLYGRIVPRSTVGKKVSGEDMAAFPLNKRGIVISYPSNREAKGGSCIFVHVWGGDGVGTAGCVALPEARVEHLQDWVRKRRHAAIAILPASALARFKDCLPSLGSISDGARAPHAQLSR
jgi:L,D-peptidoglycan transpeptidase YkuD (ErfK/YbiS/YcfS/YnhG family)